MKSIVMLVVSGVVAVFGFDAAASHSGHGSSQALAGCYDVSRGSMKVSAVGDGRVVGTYHYVFKSQDRPNSRARHLRGSVSGGESATGGTHVLNTFRRTGVLASSGDSIQPVNVSCFDPDTGKPRRIEAIETVNFTTGTGIFSRLIGGTIVFDVLFDGCTEPGNPVADLTASSGVMCFEEES